VRCSEQAGSDRVPRSEQAGSDRVPRSEQASSGRVRSAEQAGTDCGGRPEQAGSDCPDEGLAPRLIQSVGSTYFAITRDDGEAQVWTAVVFFTRFARACGRSRGEEVNGHASLTRTLAAGLDRWWFRLTASRRSTTMATAALAWPEMGTKP
jgi:hypothetical protein